MHVLPLPFGLALALMPRRDAEKIQSHKPAPEPRDGLVSRAAVRERILAEAPHRFV